MRLDINLATRPYRDLRQFLMTWGTGAAALALLTIALSAYAIYGWHSSRTTREQSSQLRSEVDKLDRERAEAIGLLNQPQNREVVSQAAFLNELIVRRSFSWTRLFMELERIMPARLRVLSITPALNKQSQIEIHMQVGGDSRQPALELVKRLEDSTSFRQAELKSESFGNLSSGDRVQFDIASIYVPQTRASEPARKETPEKPAAPAKGKQAQRPAKPGSGEGKPKQAQQPRLAGPKAPRVAATGTPKAARERSR